MASDARGHIVPASGDHPSRASLTSLSLSIRDAIPVADTTARAALIVALTAASQTPSTSNPVLVYRADAVAYEYTVDGTNWFALGKVALQSYVPVWGSSGTAPAVGNGSFVGSFSENGAWVDVDLTLTLGSTSTGGSGNYTFSLPPSPLPAAGRKWLNGTFFDSSTGSLYLFSALVVGTATMSLFTLASPVASISSSVPVIPAVGDVWHVNGSYRKA